MDSYTSGDFGVPHNYVIGRDMIIRKDHAGAMTEAALEGYVLDVVYMRNPVDLEMIMDVSDSMNSPSPSAPSGDPKLTLMQQAASMITDFLNDHGQVDDRMGLVWFTDDVSEYTGVGSMKLFPVQLNSVDLKNQITTHPTGICTAMGAGMQTAFDTLSASTNARYAILCTDGMQNIEPKAAPVAGHYEIVDSAGWLCGGHSSVPAHPGTNIASYNTRVHTIGIGITATYAPLLQDIANATGGFYRGTDDPATDLDLIYFVDLCNSLAGGSPAVVHHHAGRFEEKACEVEEFFYLNRSVRKITAMLSWQQAQQGNLTFWLRTPDGTLLDLHAEMKQFERYCMATIYLPKQQNDRVIPYVGRWKMIIRGETQNSYTDYHAIVIAEDHELKYKVDFPRKVYKVGDVLPVHVTLAINEKPLLQMNNILLEVSQLSQPLEKLAAKYQLPTGKPPSGRPPEDPFLQKLRAMQVDPAFRRYLVPKRIAFSLKEGTLVCKPGDKEMIISYPLKQAGLCSFKVAVQYENKKEGPVHRLDYVSVHVASV